MNALKYLAAVAAVLITVQIIAVKVRGQ